ncbi:MAG: 3-dehydroquinate synthase [Chloroflexi bacterium]|nr:3-dehydroquinate synthase [Chloroflexota bacterium]
MPNLILTGFSGTGKTAVGRQTARLLAWDFVDTDQEIVRQAGKPIERIFAEDGETAFRALECEALARACATPRAVIATGGGVMADPANRELMLRSGVVVCLEAQPETIYQRLFQAAKAASDPVVRPLLAGPDPLERIRTLKATRQPAYALAHWTVHTDHLSVEEVAREAVRAWETVRGRIDRAQVAGEDVAAVVHSSAGACPIFVGWEVLSALGERCRKAGLNTIAYLISDETVFHRYGRLAQNSLEEAGIPTHTFAFPPGEASKTLETASQAYRWLAGLRAQRDHFVVAVGGGVAGDLAGFVAATFNRGMPFVQVPTSVAAMVDASIGGKTAVDLPEGKNLVGAFHQPRFVLADVQALSTLPRRAIVEGLAEAIKHGLILDAELLRTFEERADAILALEPEVTTNIIRRSMAIKAQVVSQDERETLGIRALLNYGHTVGHGLEAATEYGRYLHGEAVSVGMMAAGLISQRMGMLSAEALERQRTVLERYGLPTRCLGVDLAAVQRAMQVDKKRAGKAQRWVLLEEVGKAVVHSDVPPELAQQVLRELAAP